MGYSKNKKHNQIIVNKNLFIISFLILLSFIKIIRTQELTSIITISDKDFKYINFANYSNGDMIVETSSDPYNQTRMFYGIKSNGRPFFESKNNPNNLIYIKPKTNRKRIKLNAELFIANFYEGPKKEYLISIGTNDTVYELYDLNCFNKSHLLQLNLSQLIKGVMKNIRGSAFSYFSNKYYSIFAFINGQKIFVKRIYFQKIDMDSQNIP